MIARIEHLTRTLQKRFPDAKVTWTEGYWNVRYSDGHTEFVDSYKLKDGKLVLFANIEVER